MVAFFFRDQYLTSVSMFDVLDNKAVFVKQSMKKIIL